MHPTTVSGILNGARGNSRASAMTEAQVRRIAEELGYIPSRVARQLRQGKTHSIGLIAGDIRNPFFAELAARLETLLHKQSYELLLSCRGSHPGDCLLDFLQKSVDGLVIWSEQHISDPKLATPSSRALVYLGTGPQGADRVEIDIALGLKLALEFLRDLGGKAPGFFAPEIAKSRGLPVPRATLFREIASSLGTQTGNGLFIPHADWDLKGAVKAALQIQTSSGFKQDGILAFNDVYAMAWSMAAKESGCNLPLVSFDGSPWIETMRPAIPYVKLDIDNIAEATVRLLLRRLRDPNVPPETRAIAPGFVG